MSKELKNLSPSERTANDKRAPKSRATTLYSDDEESEVQPTGDEQSDSEIDDAEEGWEYCEDDKFEVDKDVDLGAAVLGKIIDGGIEKLAAHGSQTSGPSSLAVEDNEDFDWNAV
jgi:hypothetical protein